MNVVKEIQRLNERELQLGSHNASWHDQYKGSAYVFIGGLNYEFTEGDVITIFSQYGEVMDVNLPRDKETGKTKGFGFLMYEDARSCVLAVDNLNGAKVLERTLRVDHVENYRQQKVKGEDGELVDREEQSMNAQPDLIEGSSESESEGSPLPDVDPEDPMHDYLIAKHKEEREKRKRKTKRIRPNETPEERKARKARKKARKEAKEKKKNTAGSSGRGHDDRDRRDRDRGGVSRDRDRVRNTGDHRWEIDGRSARQPRSWSLDSNDRRRPPSRSPPPRSRRDDDYYRPRR